jgi:FKBP-type peptidyl-prolyl cis-trans isomerase
VGSEKRERQKLARIEKIEAEESAARGARRKRLAIRTTVAAVVLLGGLGIYSLIAGDDGGETAADDGESSNTTLAPNECPPNVASVSTSVPYANEELATGVLDRDPPCPDPPAADTPPDAVQTETLTEGEGEGAATGQTVVVQYIGRLTDGTVFDESWSRGSPLEVTLGQGQVIPGWEEGLVGAKAGERRRLVIGSAKAYGEQGSPPTIPANAPLAFEVDVVEIKAAAPPPEMAPAAPPASG